MQNIRQITNTTHGRNKKKIKKEQLLTLSLAMVGS
jgi:hypothetical protein